MKPIVQFHGIGRLAFSAIQHFEASRNHHAFYTRDLTISEPGQAPFTMGLFAPTREGLEVETFALQLLREMMAWAESMEGKTVPPLATHDPGTFANARKLLYG